MLRNVLMVVLCGSLVVLGACRNETDAPPIPGGAESAAAAPLASEAASELTAPSESGAFAPFLFAARDGSVLMSWLQPAVDGKTTDVRIARLSGDQWSEPVSLVSRDDLFANWADFPSVVEASDGTLTAHWLQKSGSGTYAYHVWIVQSRDGGKTWGAPFRLHPDDTSDSEHGFVSLVPHPSEPFVSAAWLDGRHMTGGHEGHGDMSLRYAKIGTDGRISEAAELDDRTCECCATGMTLTSEGPVIAYRDRSEEEIRDISIVRRTSNGWTKPALLHADGWMINGCPVNGPQIEARDRDVAVSWFTSGGGKDQVLIAFSSDAGATFGQPIRIDNGAPTGRVDLVLLDDGSAAVVWLDGAGEDAAIVGRRVSRSGEQGAVVTIAKSSSARAAGFPRIASAGDAIYVAWTDVAPERRVRLARVRL
jgi:hypothetical protein